MNTAERISEKMYDYNEIFEIDEGTTLLTLMRQENCSIKWRNGWKVGDVVRYSFPDGSVITEAGACWDFGFPDCFCWKGVGHDESDCTKFGGQRNVHDEN